MIDIGKYQQEIRTMLFNGNIEEALNMLDALLKQEGFKNNQSLSDRVIEISARHKRVRRDEILNIISYEESIKQLNAITGELLTIIKRLPNTIVLKKEKEYLTEIESLINNIDIAQVERLNEIRAMLLKADQSIVEWVESLQLHEGQIKDEKRQEEINSLKVQIEVLKFKIKNEEEKYDDLKKQYDRLKKEQEQMQKLKKKITNLQGEVTELTELISFFEMQIKNKELEIEGLLRKITALENKLTTQHRELPEWLGWAIIFFLILTILRGIVPDKPF